MSSSTCRPSAGSIPTADQTLLLERGEHPGQRLRLGVLGVGERLRGRGAASVEPGQQRDRRSRSRRAAGAAPGGVGPDVPLPHEPGVPPRRAHGRPPPPAPRRPRPRPGPDRPDRGSCPSQRGVSTVEREQLVRGCRARRSGRDRAPRSGRRGRSSTADGRSRWSSVPSRARPRRPAPPAPFECPARSSPRRGRVRAGCATPSGRSRAAAAHRRRSGSRARRPSCRSPPAGRREDRGYARPAPPLRARRRSRRAPRVADSRERTRAAGTSPARPDRRCATATRRLTSRMSVPSIVIVPDSGS